MEVKKSLDLLAFYKRKLRFDAFLYAHVPKRFQAWFNAHYQSKHRNKLQLINFLIKLLLYSVIYIVVSITWDLKLMHMGIVAGFYVLNIIFTSQNSLRHDYSNLKRDQYFKSLGNKRYLYFHHLILDKMNRQFTNGLLPLILFPGIYFSVMEKSFFLFLFFVAIFSCLYFITIAQAIVSNYLFAFVKNKGFELIASTLYNLGFYSLMGTIFLIGFLITFSLHHFKLNEIHFFSPLNLAVISVYLFSLTLLFAYLVKTVLIPFIKTHYGKIVHIAPFKKRKVLKKHHSNLFVKLTKLFLVFNHEKENILIQKDFKMLFRGQRKILITLGFSYLFYLIFGMLLNSVFTEQTIYVPSLLLIGVLNTIGLFNFYQLSGTTWMGAEGFNLGLYYKMKVNYYLVFKAKLKLNVLLFMPGFVIYMILSGIGLKTSEAWFYWFCFGFYLIQSFLYLIEMILYLDVTKPPLKPEYQMNWIGDKGNLFTLGSMYILAIPFAFGVLEGMEASDEMMKWLLVSFITLLLLLRINLRRQVKRLKKAKIITFGGVIYD